MAEDSQSCPETGKKSTGKISRLTRDQALEIVQQSLVEYQATGGPVEVLPVFYFEGRRYVGILLEGVEYVNGKLTPVNGKGDTGTKK